MEKNKKKKKNTNITIGGKLVKKKGIQKKN